MNKIKLLRVSAVSTILGVSPSAVRAMGSRGVLPMTRIGSNHRRFSEDDVLALRDKILEDLEKTDSFYPEK